MAGRNDPSWPPSYIPRLGTVRALRTYQWSETPMARWARRGVGASIRASRPRTRPRRRRADPSLSSGQKKEPGSTPALSERTRAPPDRQNLWHRTEAPRRRQRGSRSPATATAGDHCMRERRLRGRDSGACMHRARFWRPGAAGSQVLLVR